MREQVLSKILQRVWKIFSLCDSYCELDWLLRVLWTIKRSPSHGYGSSLFPHLESTLSLDSSPWLLYSSLPLKIVTLLLGHWDAMWPLPRNLKHWISIVQGYEVDSTLSLSLARFLGSASLDGSFLYPFPLWLFLGLRHKMWIFPLTWSFPQILLFNFDTKFEQVIKISVEIVSLCLLFQNWDHS